MDMLTLMPARAYAKMLVDDIVFVADSSDLFDRRISVGVLLNYIHQSEDAWAYPGFTEQHGSVTLTNTASYPFNSSKSTVSLGAALPDTTYIVIPEVVSSVGNAGDLEVSDKLTNGFKLSYNGSASSVVVNYIVIGGFTE